MGLLEDIASRMPMGAALKDFHYVLMGAMNLNPFFVNMFEYEDWLVMSPFILMALFVNHRLLFYPLLYIVVARPKEFNRGMMFWSALIWACLMLTS